MNSIKTKIMLISVLCATFSLQGAQSISLVSLKEKYDTPVAVFVSSQEDTSAHQHTIMNQVFSHFKRASSDLIKELQSDIKILKKALKKSFEEEVKYLYDQLLDLQGYIKKHRTAFDAMHYHEQLRDRYQDLFEKVTAEEDVIAHIDENRKKFDLQKCDDSYLDTFLKGIGTARRKVSKFEDYVHANYVDVKLTNYVFKIDLVRLRNAILFDKRYRDKK